MVRRLHVGGEVRADGWEVLNIVAGPHVDHVGDARDLSRFEAGSFLQIYASHVVEHLDYKDELLATLQEWRRVLQPGGHLMISVPDLDVMARLLLDREQLDTSERYAVMRMLFGGHMDEFDFHKVGLNQDFLAHFLRSAGFVHLRRVEDFGLFDDASRLRFKGIPISLNLVANRPDG